MQLKRRLTKSLLHKAILIKEELCHDNAVIPNALSPAPPTPATPPPPESLNQPPPPAVKRAVRRLGIGDQQTAESSPPPGLEAGSSIQDWLPMVNHYPTPPPAPRKHQTLLSCSEYDAEYDSNCYPRPGPTSSPAHDLSQRARLFT